MRMSRYLVTIGLEIHCQVKTASKMFCSCAVEYGAEPNTRVCPVCLGLPGALPALNREAIRLSILAGLMFGCRIPEVTTWDRKNYFYPDMPKNYQLSQLHAPVCQGGEVGLDRLHFPNDFQKQAPEGKVVRLDHIHLEEDVGKSTHYENNSLIDFNRAGTPLMEIVTEPDMESAEEAVALLNALRQNLIYGGVSDADMEKGQLRCDVNISLRPPGQKELGAKIELKNLNSISAVRRAIHHEIERQSAELDAGIPQVQSTRRWDDDAGETTLLRTKEDAHDYRYLPDPDLPAVETAELLAAARRDVPELPHHKRQRFTDAYGITPYDAGVLAADRALADWFEQAASAAPAGAKKTANWVINELLARLNADSLHAEQCPVSPQRFAALVDLVSSGGVSQNQGKEILDAMFAGDAASPEAIAAARGFEQVSDSSSIEPFVDQVLAEFPDKVEEWKQGNAKVGNWLTGQVMRHSKGKANPRVVSEMLRSRAGLE